MTIPEWEFDPRGPMTAEKLERIVTWLDELDRYLAADGRSDATPAVQEDLAYWAECIRLGTSPIKFPDPGEQR